MTRKSFFDIFYSFSTHKKIENNMINFTRENFKDEIYLDIAESISKLSKDVNTKIGAIIVAKDGTPVSWGYNGTISGFNDLKIPHSREEMNLSFSQQIENTNVDYISFVANKYPFMCHAESNAIFFAENKTKLIGSTIYINGMPCENCAKEIARAKIGKVVVRAKNIDSESTLNKNSNITKFIFANAKIKLIINKIEIKLDL